MNAPIKYFGGKGTMFKNIIEYFPDKESYDTYIEPFGGSYSVGLHLQDDKMEIYNDLNKNVYSLYKVIQDTELFSRFKFLCDTTIYSEELRDEYKSILKNVNDNIDIVQRAFAFFYVNRTSVNGIGGLSVNLVPRRKMSKSTSDYLSCVDRLEELHQRMSRVIILNRNGIDLIEKYNTENIFLYCDPPYVQSTRGTARYDIDMPDEIHNNFIDACIKSKAKILISGYDNELYKRLEDNGFTKITFDVNTVDGKNSPKSKTEVLWKNY